MDQVSPASLMRLSPRTLLRPAPEEMQPQSSSWPELFSLCGRASACVSQPVGQGMRDLSQDTFLHTWLDSFRQYTGPQAFSSAHGLTCTVMRDVELSRVLSHILFSSLDSKDETYIYNEEESTNGLFSCVFELLWLNVIWNLCPPLWQLRERIISIVFLKGPGYHTNSCGYTSRVCESLWKDRLHLMCFKLGKQFMSTRLLSHSPQLEWGSQSEIQKFKNSWVEVKTVCLVKAKAVCTSKGRNSSAASHGLADVQSWSSSCVVTSWEGKRCHFKCPSLPLLFYLSFYCWARCQIGMGYPFG